MYVSQLVLIWSSENCYLKNGCIVEFITPIYSKRSPSYMIPIFILVIIFTILQRLNHMLTCLFHSNLICLLIRFDSIGIFKYLYCLKLKSFNKIIERYGDNQIHVVFGLIVITMIYWDSVATISISKRNI